MTQPSSTEQNVERPVIKFAISDQVFAIPAESVVEVVELPKFTQIPQTPRYVAGVFVRKGRVVAVLDLQEWLGLSDDEKPGTNAVVIERREFLVAVQSDQVFGLEQMQFSSGETNRLSLSNRVNELTIGTNDDDGLVALLDLDALLDATAPGAV